MTGIHIDLLHGVLGLGALIMAGRLFVLGALIGSNLFNGLAIVGVASSIHPISVPPTEIVVTLACGVAALLFLLPNRAGLIPRGRGFLLLVLYGLFNWATLAAARY